MVARDAVLPPASNTEEAVLPVESPGPDEPVAAAGEALIEVEVRADDEGDATPAAPTPPPQASRPRRPLILVSPAEDVDDDVQMTERDMFGALTPSEAAAVDAASALEEPARDGRSDSD